VNTDIGREQGQNQYDSWKNSRWYHQGDVQRTVGCRECHMPLQPSRDPAAGDATDYNRTAHDGQHRSHRMLGGNQYVPVLHDLPGAALHVRLTESWLRGEIEVPEIAEKWTTGPVVRLALEAPPKVSPGERFTIHALFTNNKTGHDFPTGPLDMIESWVELKVSDASGQVLYHAGALNEDDAVFDAPIWFKADGFDRQGQLIDRHNLWDLVGAKYKRSLFPGVTDALEVTLQCPLMARGRLLPNDQSDPGGQRTEAHEIELPDDARPGMVDVEAVLWYRKANPAFLDRVYGVKAEVRSPLTRISQARASIQVVEHAEASDQ